MTGPDALASLELLRAQALAGDGSAGIAYADALEEAGQLEAATDQRARTELLDLLRTDAIPRRRRRKEIVKLTGAEEAALPAWANRWVGFHTTTGPADLPLFEAGALACYRLSGLPEPARVEWCASPVALRAAMRGAERAPVEDLASRVDAQIRARIHEHVRWQIDTRVARAVRRRVELQVVRHVSAAAGRGATPASMWGSAATTFFIDVLHLHIGDELERWARAWAAAARSVWAWYPMRDTCLACERPAVLERDPSGELVRARWGEWEVIP